MEKTNEPTADEGVRLPTRVPCGHTEDALTLQATTSLLVYCSRCERGFDAPFVSA